METQVNRLRSVPHTRPFSLEQVCIESAAFDPPHGLGGQF